MTGGSGQGMRIDIERQRETGVELRREMREKLTEMADSEGKGKG